jgi:hypothetical protein
MDEGCSSGWPCAEGWLYAPEPDRVACMSVGRMRLVVVAVVAVVGLTVGCGGSTKTVTVGQTGTSTTSTSSTPSGGSEAGKLGDTESVTINGVALDATIADLENPAKTDTTPSSIGEPGKYWVRVTATLVNKGSKPLDSSADASFTLIDSKGEQVYGNDVTAVGPAPQLSGTLLPGDKLSGAVVFLVPNGAQPDEVRLSSFAGGIPARWSLQ